MIIVFIIIIIITITITMIIIIIHFLHIENVLSIVISFLFSLIISTLLILGINITANYLRFNWFMMN